MSIIPDICSMQILLAAATTFEIQPAIDFLGQFPPRQAGHGSGQGTRAGHGVGADHSVRTLITGVGSLATVWSLMRQIDRQRPDIIIQAGIAGCFAGRQPSGVVVVGEEIPGDLGVWEDQRWKSLFDLKLADKDAPPFSNGVMVNPYKKLIALTGLETVRGMTVNEITTDPVRIGWYQRQNELPQPSVVVESMEGGGLHYVCLQEKIAFLQLRSVSNEIGVRDKTKWDIKGAIDRLNTQLIDLLKKLHTQDQTIIDL